MKGKIIKGIAGFYYVHAGDALHSTDGIYECKAKGVFRKDHRKPLVGDDVEMDIIDEAQKKGNITGLLPRHSELIRPAVANVDQALVIFAICKPQPNFNLLDRFLIMMQQQDIPCIICFNKQDIDAEGKKEDYRSIYEQAGFQTITVSARERHRQIKRPASGQDHHGGGTQWCRQVFAGQLFTVGDRDGDRFHQ